MDISCCAFWFFMTVFSRVQTTVWSLQCYTCEAEDTNENCNTNELPVLQTCPATEDQCLTQVIYSSERGKLRIDKSCTSQEGCVAATQQLGKRYFCDKSRSGWGCVQCCDTEKCNVSRLARSTWSSGLIVGALCAYFLVVHCLLVR